MPPPAVKTVRDLIYWQYAKIISESAGQGKKKYSFIMDRFKKLQSGDIEWSGAIREYIKERESPKECIYCGSTGTLTMDGTTLAILTPSFTFGNAIDPDSDRLTYELPGFCSPEH